MDDQERVKKQKYSETKQNSTQIFHRPPYVPEEIVRNILSPLPVKSLLRFKCISKPWSVWISETTRTGNNRKLLLTVPGDGNYPTQRTIDQTGLVEAAHIPFDKMCDRVPPSTHYKFFGSCNGLLLISIHQDLYLCNLTTRRFSRILTFEYLSDSYSSCTIVGELCFDSGTDDYLVVMAVSHRIPRYSSSTIVGEEFVTVGSARNKFWKKIRFPYTFRLIKQGAVLSNRLHWCTTRNNEDPFYEEDENSFYEEDENSQSWRIIYFDPKRYEFVELPVPETMSGEGISIGTLGVLRGCLCMTSCINVDDHDQCDVDVLIMREYGVKESWTLLFKFHGVSNLRDLVPYFYTTRREHEVLMRVLMSYSKEFIVMYDTEREVYTDFIPGELCGMHTVYEESLVEPPIYGGEDP